MVGTYRYQHGDKPLEGYTILRGIGRGGFGEVYYAVSDGGREVAIKAIQQNTDIELRGVRHCINLKSPHLISIFDVRRNADGASFVIMEYVAGVSLRDVIARESQGMSADKAAFLVREIAKGLGYLHERGIVHRDLKPENIFYEDGYAKIGDYGLSKYISVSRQSGQTISVGTVHYMAPEIGSGNYSQGIDVYALGIIFFELLTGTVPFNGDSMGEILMKHLTQEPDVSRLEARFQPIVRKALAKSPLDRYQSAREMVDSIFADEELASAVARLDAPSFLSAIAPSATNEAAEALAALQTTDLRSKETTPVPPPAPLRGPAPAQAPFFRAADARGAPAQGPVWREMRRHLVQGGAITGAAALALSLFSSRGSSPAVAFLGYFSLIAATAAAILGVEHWFVPRFNIASGFVRRCVTFGLVGPVLALILAMSEGIHLLPGRVDRLFLGLAAGLFAIDWHERCRPKREEHVSAGLAIAAGLFGLVAAAVTWGTGSMAWSSPLLGFGLLAAVSLVTNAISPFQGKDKPARARSPAPAAAPPPEPVVPPPPPAPLVFPAPVLAAPGTRLIRPRSGILAAGVCAAFARAYGWDTTVVRLIAAVLLFATFPLGFIAYVACWFILPEEAAPPRPPRQPRQWGFARRVLLGLGAAGFFVASLLYAAETHLRNTEQLTICIALNLFGALCVIFAGKSRSKNELTTMDPAPGRWLARLGSAGLITGMINAALAGLGNTAWGLLGNDPLSWMRRPGADDVFTWVAVAAFALATVCFATSRFQRNFEHGLRGFLGWAGMSVVLMAACLHGMEMLRRADQHFGEPFTLSPEELLGFTALGVVSLVLLGWPARRRLPPPVPAARPVEGTLA